MGSVALLSLHKLRREFPSGDETITVLKDIDLEIHAGEMIAIIGASGSGKSTLMNILGCLDRPTSGSYQVAGRATAELSPDELAKLRREHFGFIFQRYHLLADLSALGNVEVPAIYASKDPKARRIRAESLLNRLGLANRTGHKPAHLSGGQQQRVSIARALMNGGEVILADEPTGALDSASGEEVMRILQELHREGHTVILVTHDQHVAQHAQRIIEISDGEIVADRQIVPRQVAHLSKGAATLSIGWWHAVVERFAEAFHMALLAMMAHRLRTFLTMLGIIIGITSVVSVVALGNGTQQQILASISELGTNTLDVMPGRDFGDQRANAIQTLTIGDVNALATQPYVDGVTPSVSTNVTARYRNIAANAQVEGVGAEYFRVRGLQLARGALFGAAASRQMDQVAVIDQNSASTLFPNQQNPIGEIILLSNMPVRVVGVLKKREGGFGNSSNLAVYVPYTTVAVRLLGQSRLQSVTVRVADSVAPDAAEQAVKRLLTMRHGITDFFIFNTNDIRKAVTSTTTTMTLLVAAIAVISLIVGGIGVMNIMLVSVTERTREIGVRMAVGARQSDILQQFLIEAVLVCLIGGVIGVGIALGLGLVVAKVGGNFKMIFSSASIIAAFACSTIIGVVFGFLPARNAARLDPIEALARD